MNELRASYEKKGLRILAITSEKEDVVASFMAERGITYTVGLSADAAGGYGSGGIPHAYLINPKGKIVWEGNPHSLSNGTIEDAMRGAKPYYLRKVAPVLKAAAGAFKRGKLGEARQKAEAVKEAGTATEDADYIIGQVQRTLDAWQSGVKTAVRVGLYKDAFDGLAKIKKHFAGTRAADAAEDELKSLKVDKQVKKELKATKKLVRLYEAKSDAGRSAKKLKAVRKKIEKFIAKNTGLKAAKRADALLKSIDKAMKHAR